MSSPKRKRDVPVLFWVSADEMELIQQKMAQFGTKNLSAYLRKMAVDGYVVQLDLPELKELVSLLRRSSNNLNQLTRKVHETGRNLFTLFRRRRLLNRVPIYRKSAGVWTVCFHNLKVQFKYNNQYHQNEVYH